jgi:serine/threonine-protein kinase
MSPEQAMGDRELDARSDIYSLGAMLFEMLAGDPPYTGNSAQAIVAKVITEKAPPVTTARDTVPGHVAAAIGKALAKMPADRFKTAAALADALSNPGFTLPTTAPVAHATAGTQGTPVWRRVGLPTAFALVAALALWGWLRPQPGPDRAVARLDLNLGGIVQARNSDVVISVDGTMLAVNGTRGGESGIWVRGIRDADFRRVPGTENVIGHHFSPDGEWLVFRNDRQSTLVKAAVSGSGTFTVVDRGAVSPWAPSWTVDTTILFTGPNGMHLVPPGGGALVPLKGTAFGFGGPFMLPDGSGILGNGRGGGVALYAFAADTTVQILPDGRGPVYVRTGHILYVPQSGGLFAVPFDLATHQVTGAPVRVLDQVASGFRNRGFSVSENGTIVYEAGASIGSGVAEFATRLTLFDRDGRADTLRLPEARRIYPRFSPDGRAIAFEQFDPLRAPANDVFTFDLVTETVTQITFDGDNDVPVWSPDGTRLLFNIEGTDSTTGEDPYIKPADNSAEALRVLTLPGNQQPVAWLPGDTIVFENDASGNSDLFILDLSGGGDPVPYLQSPWGEWDFARAPDGALAAFVSRETDVMEVWLRDFPVPEGKWRVSFGGGQEPRWSPDGRTLYFWRIVQGMSPDTLFAVPITREPRVSVGQPEFVLAANMNSQGWDVHPDGKRFIVPVVSDRQSEDDTGAPADNRLYVVLNWFDELQERLGGR